MQVSGTDKVGEELIFPNGITGHDDVCNNLSLENYPVYIDFQDGRWLAFDPMLKLIENDLETPAANGGLDAFVHGSSCKSRKKYFCVKLILHVLFPHNLQKNYLGKLF